MASVLARMTVMRPLPSSQRWTSPRLGAARSGVGQHGPKATSNFASWAGLLGGFEAVSAAMGAGQR